MKNEIVEIIKSHDDEIDNDAFVSSLESAIEKDVIGEIVDAFFIGGVSVPTSQILEAMKKHYIDNDNALNDDEKEEKMRKIEYMINKCIINIFEVNKNIEEL